MDIMVNKTKHLLKANPKTHGFGTYAMALSGPPQGLSFLDLFDFYCSETSNSSKTLVCDRFGTDVGRFGTNSALTNMV